MDIKKSGLVGSAIERLLQTEDKSGEQLAMDLNISSQHLSNMKQGRRTMQSDIARESIALYDSPEYSMDILWEFSSNYTSPVLRGNAIEQHRLAMEANAKREIEQALHTIQTVCLAKPPEVLTQIEKDAVKKMADELIEARVLIDNFLKQIQIDYKITIKDRIKALIPTWKSKGWLQ